MTAVPTPAPEKQAAFARLTEAVLARRPSLKEKLEQHGTEKVFDFVRAYLATPSAVHFPERQKELIASVSAEVERLLGKDIAASTAKQLAKYYRVSTADHYGPNYHPWVTNFNAISAAIYMADPDPVLDNVITFACANVSLNNFSFPRGFSFTCDATGTLKLSANRLSFLPSNAHSFPVYGFRAFTSQEIQKMKDRLNEMVRLGQVHADESAAVKEILDTIYSQSEVLSARYYSDQITKTNCALWQRLLQHSPKKINFAYIEQEWIVADLLIKHHLFTKSLINELLFNPESEQLLSTYFRGLPESFSKSEGVGTYLFWGLPRTNCNHRLRMWKEGNVLKSEDSTYWVEWTPEGIQNALERKELIPSVLLTFIVLCFYYELECLGGLGQINYLPRLQEAYVKMRRDQGDSAGAAAAEKIPTKNLGAELTVGLVRARNGETAPATLIDWLIHDDGRVWECLTKEMHLLTFAEAIMPMFPEDYPMLYKQDERDEALKAITPKDITILMKLDEKVTPCIDFMS